MYRGNPPTTGDHPSSSTPSTMMLANPSRLPSIPSRPAPSQSFSSRDVYRGSCTAPPRSDVIPASQLRDRHEADLRHAHATQLPSLRTLLAPEILDSKVHASPSRSSNAQYTPGLSTHLDSISPTLKRRHDFDGCSYDKDASHSSTTCRVAPLYHPAASPIGSRTHSATTGTQSPQLLTHTQYGNPSRLSHSESYSKSYRPTSSISAMSASSDPTGTQAHHLEHENSIGSANFTRKRTESLARAPVKTTRYVGQRNIPGEGICFVYDDGTHCRAMIDGEPVNPSWGITKAGKPRKRLAQACLTCREKKIKCEPGYPKCHQCTKSQRECRGGLKQHSTSNASGETSPISSLPSYKSPSSELPQSVVQSDTPKCADEVDHWHAQSPSKSRAIRPTLGTGSLRDMSVHSIESDWSGSLNDQEAEDSRPGILYHDHVVSDSERNPFTTYPRMTMHLLESFFQHAGRATYEVFPRQQFLAWVKSDGEKSPDQLMALYSVLALGSVFSSDPETLHLGRRFASIATLAAAKRFGKMSLQLCHTRLSLALYNFACGKSQEAWDFCGAGLRAISALNLNTEDGIQDLLSNSPDLDYGFDLLTFKECCRRTFWTGFLIERYPGFCASTLCAVNTADVFVRLPCLEVNFQSALICDTPLYSEGLLLRRHPSDLPALGNMAHLVLIAKIWGDIAAFGARVSHRADAKYEHTYESFYAKISEELERWHAMLPDHLRFSQRNIEINMQDGNVTHLISLHAFYHAAVIRMNRHVRARDLAANKLVRNIDVSLRSASIYMEMMHTLVSTSRGQEPSPDTAIDHLFASPSAAYTLMLSVDVLSAAGMASSLQDLHASLNETLSVLEMSTCFLASARSQLRMTTHRVRDLGELSAQTDRLMRDESFHSFWRLRASLESSFGEDDIMYHASEQTLFEAIQGLSG